MAMIQNEFRAPKDEKEELQARITIMASGGSIEANVERWKSQFDLANKEAAKFEKKEVAGMTVHLADLVGTYKEMMASPPKKSENYRMLGAIIETKNAGNYYVKITGPAATVEKLKTDFNKMVQEMVAK
jgi:gluconolactonase